MKNKNHSIVSRETSVQLATRYGWGTFVGYSDSSNPHLEHVALVIGNVAGRKDVLTRIHSKCCTGETLGSRICDCGEQKDMALKAIEKNGSGIFVYLDQEGRGIGLLNKLRAYRLQSVAPDGQEHLGRSDWRNLPELVRALPDTFEANEKLGFPADGRDHGIGAQILSDIGVRSIRLMTNNPDKLRVLADHGIEVTEQIPLFVAPDCFNGGYLDTKREKAGHLLPLYRGRNQIRNEPA